MKIIFTGHVNDKLKEPEAKSLGITKNKIIEVIKEPTKVDKSINLSLCIIWKIEKGGIKVVTFYPAEKGRYENKILRRR